MVRWWRGGGNNRGLRDGACGLGSGRGARVRRIERMVRRGGGRWRGADRRGVAVAGGWGPVAWTLPIRGAGEARRVQRVRRHRYRGSRRAESRAAPMIPDSRMVRSVRGAPIVTIGEPRAICWAGLIPSTVGHSIRPGWRAPMVSSSISRRNEPPGFCRAARLASGRRGTQTVSAGTGSAGAARCTTGRQYRSPSRRTSASCSSARSV